MDYREALLKLNEKDLRFAYEQVFQEVPADDMHSLELIESVRKEVLSNDYLQAVLLYLPDDEYEFYLRAVKAGHEYIPMRAEKLPQSLARLLIFDSSNGLLLPSDLVEEVKRLNLTELEEKRLVVKQQGTFITGVMYLYGAVHEELIAELYEQFFDEALSVHQLDVWIDMLDIRRINDMVMLPEIFESLSGMETPKYVAQAYYQPRTLDELSNYSGPEHHRHTEEMKDFIAFVQSHSGHIDSERLEELIEFMVFLIISMSDANAVMEQMINVYAKYLNEQEFASFEKKFIKVMNTTRLWMFKGKTKAEADAQISEQEVREEQEKEKKVIDLNVFRNDN